MIFEVNINDSNTEMFLETETRINNRPGLFRVKNNDRLYYDEDLDSITMIHYNRNDTWCWIKVVARDPRFIHGISKSRSDLNYLKKTGIFKDITKSLYRDSKLNSLLK